jgi:uncharacterized OB-fold protein
MTAVSQDALTRAKVLDRRRMEVTDDGSFRLLGIRCRSCGTLSHPVRRHCPACGGAAETIELATSGLVIAATTARTARAELLIEPPYQVVLAQLAGGPALKLPSLEDTTFGIGDPITIEPLVLDAAEGPVAVMQARHVTTPAQDRADD